MLFPSKSLILACNLCETVGARSRFSHSFIISAWAGNYPLTFDSLPRLIPHLSLHWVVRILAHSVVFLKDVTCALKTEMVKWLMI
jgi:hypothetical protein